MTAPHDRLSHPKYRADIDGLRAVAVLSVVCFHAFPRQMQGGFVGVDIFFVISGYLISTIIFENLDRGTFSFSEFYARRIKRIFPSLVVVLLSVLAFGWFFLLGDEYDQLGKHTLAGAAFVSNFVLWSESGYFDATAHSKPLLHLWSLGIEEQFYICWPLLLWVAWRRRIGLLLVITTVLAASLVFNLYNISRDAVGTFYSPLTRVWELSAGSALAWLSLYWNVNHTRLSVVQCNLASALGAAGLVGAMLLTPSDASFPGWRALPPVAGAVLIILAGGNAWLNRVILSHRAMVWFGLISYPLYLWHWPVLSMGFLAAGQTPAAWFRIVGVLAAVLLAGATYRFVERPVRSSRGARFVAALASASVVLAVAGAYVHGQSGLLERRAVTASGFTEEVRQQFLGGPSWPYVQNRACLDRYPFRDADAYGWWFCVMSAEKPPSLVILGSSFANQLYPGFVKNPRLSRHVVLSIGTCDFGGMENPHVDEANPCHGPRMRGQERFIDDLIARERTIRFAVIDGLYREPSSKYIGDVKRRIDDLEGLGIQVIVFTPHIQPHVNPKVCFTAPLRWVARDCTFPARDREVLFESFKPLVDSIAKTNPRVRFFEQNEIFCPGSRCSLVENGVPLHRDLVHLSEYGSIRLQEYFTTWAATNVPELLDPPAGQEGRSESRIPNRGSR